MTACGKVAVPGGSTALAPGYARAEIRVTQYSAADTAAPSTAALVAAVVCVGRHSCRTEADSADGGGHRPGAGSVQPVERSHVGRSHALGSIAFTARMSAW